MRRSSSRPTVQSELAEMIGRSGKTHRQIAREAGFPKANVISMMKTGEMKVPLKKAPGLAIACHADPVAFTRLVMEEYEPRAWATLQETLGRSPSPEEQALLDLLREVAPRAGVNLVQIRRELEAMRREAEHPFPDDPVALALRAMRLFGPRPASPAEDGARSAGGDDETGGADR